MHNEADSRRVATQVARADGPEMVVALERRMWRSEVPVEACLKMLHDAVARYPHHVGLAARLALRQRDQADWSEPLPDFAALLALGGSISSPLDLQFLIDDPVILASAAASAAQYYTARAPQPRRLNRAPSTKGRLRIGYASGDFRAHALGQLAIGLIEHHDRSRFETVGYGLLRGDGSAMHQRFLTAFDRFHELSDASADAIIEQIHQDEIDILVHLSGYTHGGRCEVLTTRLAPIVVNYLGYPGTLAMPTVDYIMGDPIVFGPDMIGHVTERPVLLPGCYQPNQRAATNGPIAERAAHGLPEHAFVLCCFNTMQKLSEPVFACWMRVLRAVPNAVLWLLDSPRGAPGSRLRAAAEARGVARDRIVMAPFLPSEAHSARLSLADLGLDTAPYGAHTTGSDLLWAGVPLIAHRGRGFAARVSASLLCAAGLPELIAPDLETYERLILELASDRDRLTALRQHLIEGREHLPLFDAARTTRQIETAFEQMWRTYCAHETPRGFFVPGQGSASIDEIPNLAL